MKKILLFVSILSLGFVACKKDHGNPSIVVSVSYPEINFNNGGLFTISVGGTLPTASQVATAVDTVYTSKPVSLVLVDSTVDVNVPGIYQATAIATNYYGYITRATYYVAVTNLPSAGAPNLAGTWWLGSNDSANTVVASVGNGYYSSNNFAGVNTYTDPSGETTGYFVLTSDSTFLFVNETDVNGNYLSGTLSIVSGDTTMTYTPAGGATLTFTRH